MTCVVVATIVSPTGDGLAAALSVSGALLAVASVSMVRRATGMRLARVHRGDGNTRRMLSYGLPLAATGLAGTLGYQFDRIVVGVSFSSQEFAVYALGAVEVPLGLLIAAAVSNVLVPRLTILWRDGDRAGMVALWREAMRKTSLVLLPLFAFMLLMSSDLVLLLYGPGYSESVEVFRVYLFLLPLRIATWGLIPMALGRTGINLQASILILAVNAGVALALIGPLGLIGAALAAPISAVAAATYYLVRVRSIAALHVHDLVPVRALTGTLAVSFLAAAPLLAIRELPVAAGIRLVVAAIIFGVIAPLGLRADPQDLRRRLGPAARRHRAAASGHARSVTSFVEERAERRKGASPVLASTAKRISEAPRRRVLMLAYFFPPLGGGGVQRTLKHVKYLPDEGFDAIVLTTRLGWSPMRDPTLGGEVPPETVVIRAPELPLRLDQVGTGRSAAPRAPPIAPYFVRRLAR